MAISDYSTTPASNTLLSGINLAENQMVPSDVNNALRQLMADIKAGVPYLSSSQFLFESTDAGAAAGPIVNLYRNSASPAASDILGKLLFNGEDSAGNTQEYASIETVIVGATSTSEDGQLDFYVTKAGTRTKFQSMTATATAFTGAAAYSMDAPLTVTSTAAGTVATFTSTDAGAGLGPKIVLYRDSASPAANDVIGDITFSGEDSAGNAQDYARLFGTISNPTSTSEGGFMTMQVTVAGALANFMRWGANAAGTATAAAVGLPLGQLSFPASQNASSDANTLDDYEEGTFTPAFSSSGATFSHNAQTATYVKVGQLVYFTLTCSINTSGNTLTANPLTITGLPFTSKATTRYGLAVQWFASTSSYVTVLAEVNANATTITLYGLTAAATSSFAAVNSNALLHATNGSSLIVSGCYQAAA